MTVLIFGIGVGLFTILALWTLSLILCILSYRTQKNLGATSVVLSLLITIVLVSIPREPENGKSATVIKVFDNLFIWKIAVIIFLALSVLCGFVCYLFSDLMVPCHALPIKQWRL